jgi:HK97 family phage portal protein
MQEKEFNPEAYMKADLKRRGFPDTVERATAVSKQISFVGSHDEPNKPAVREIANLEHKNRTGVPHVHPLALMTALADNCTWVDLVMRVIGSAAASTSPLFRFELTTQKSYKKKRQADVDEVADVLQYPNLNQTGYELFRTIYENLVLYGNAYIQVIKNKAGGLHSLYTLPPESIRVVPYLTDGDVLHFAYLQQGMNDKPRVFLEDEIIHFKTGNSKSFVYGKPLFLPQLTEIAANINANKAITSWFEQGFAGGAIFKMDADEDVANRNREYIKEYFTKPENFGRTMLLEGNMELVKDGNKFEGFDFSALSNTNRDNLIMGAGVPLSQAGIRSDSGNANAEIVAAEESAFVRNTLSMYHALVFDKLNARLIREFLGWKDVKICAGVPIKFSMKDSIETVRALSEIGIGVNEARDLLSAPRVPSEEAGAQFVTATNNGVMPMEKITGIDPNTGEKVETIFEEDQAMQKKSMELKSGASGLGGNLKAKAEGKSKK